MTDPAKSLHVEILDALGAIDEIAADWSALEARTPEATGFQRFEWCRTWLAAQQASGRPSKPYVATVRDQGRLVMVWPLEVERRAAIVIAQWIGEPVTQYGDILAEPGANRRFWFEAARDHLARAGGVDLFAFSRLRADSAFYHCGAGPSGQGACLGAPFAGLAQLGQARQGRFGNKSMARRAKLLASLGPVSLHVIEDPAARAAAVRLALSQKRSWLKARGLYSSGLSHPSTDAFMGEAAATGVLAVHALQVADEKAALEIGFVHRTAYRSLLGSFDLRFAAGSPGHALTAMLIAHCAAQGLETFDFLAPADPYKTIWAKDMVAVGAQLQPATLLGHAGAFALGRLRPLAKGVQGALPLGARLALRKIAARAA